MKTAVIELVDDEPAVVPERSRLYRLAPINPFSGFVESLTSYIARLAAAHCLPLWVLVTREIAPLFSRKSIVDPQNGHCDLLAKFGASVNGNNATAIEAVEAVARLTTQNGLRNLTMLLAGDDVAATPLLRSTQAWCPRCLQDWSQSGQELYYPLLWSLAAVQFCPTHQSALIDTCDQCHRTHHPLARRLRVGHCPRCNSWLGSSHAKNQPESARYIRPTPWQLFSATSAAELMGDLASGIWSNGTPATCFTANVSTIVQRLFDGSKNAFATYTGVHQKSVCHWLVGLQKPSFRAVLLLAYRFGVSPSALVLAPLDESEATLRRPASAGDDVFLRPPLRQIAPSAIEQTLHAALDNPSWPPSSLRTVCTRGGFHQTQASNRFPELARKISDGYRFYRSEKRRQGEYFMKMLVRAAVYEVCWSGEYPNLNKVKAKLAPGVSLRAPSAKAEFQAVVRELGFDIRPSGAWLAASA